MTSHESLHRSSYWLIRELLKHTPEKSLDGRPMKGYLTWMAERPLKELHDLIRVAWVARTEHMTPKGWSSSGDLMTVDEWVECVNAGGFVDNDGSGELATATEVSDIGISPSDITALKLPLPAWATHVMWYNK